jgi:hypothetical protein
VVAGGRRHLPLLLLLLLLRRPSLLLVVRSLGIGFLTSAATPGVTCRRARQVLRLVVVMVMMLVWVISRVPNLLLHVVCRRGIPSCMRRPLPMLLLLLGCICCCCHRCCIWPLQP